MMKMATREGFPPPAGCRNGSRLVFCGTPDLGYVLEVWVYIRGFGVGNKSVLEICPGDNNKVVILYFLIHDKDLLFMLE